MGILKATKKIKSLFYGCLSLHRFYLISYTRMSNLLHVMSPEQFTEEVINFDGVVVVDFYADWCGPCRMLGPIMEELHADNEAKNVKIIKIDVDTNPTIAAEYGITGIPAVFVFANGQQAANMVGVQPKEVYQAKIDELLAE